VRRIGQQANKFQREKLANVFNMKGGAVFEQDLGCCPHQLGAPRLLVKLHEEVGVERGRGAIEHRGWLASAVEGRGGDLLGDVDRFPLAVRGKQCEGALPHVG
jgi:hypothetical protein